MLDSDMQRKYIGPSLHERTYLQGGCILVPLNLGGLAQWFHDLAKEAHMSRYLLVLAIVLGFPLSGLAQFVDKGEYVVVSKGVKLCTNAALDSANRVLDPENRYWRVTSAARANGTQTVEGFVLESSYDRKSGETTIEERQYDEGYATRFKRAAAHKGMLLMVSPKDGQIEATVEICRKHK